MKLKKLCSIALAATMLFGGTALLPEDTFTFGTSITASADSKAKSGKCGENVRWSLSDDGVLTISGTGKMYDYYNCDSPFFYSIIDIIKSVVIESGVTSIGYGAFEDSSRFTSVTIPSSVTSIGERAFEGCTSLTSATMQNGVTSIGDYAFEDCTSLTSINIPSSVTSIGGGAFSGCTSLTNIDVDSNNYIYSSVDGVLYNKDKTKLIKCPGGKTSVTIPSSVKSIGNFAFNSCTSLTSVTIPSSVKSIGDDAFSYCSNLSSITIPTSVTSIGGHALYGTKWLENRQAEDPIVVVNGILIDGKKCSGNVTIPSSVTSIGDYAFYNCTSLTSVTIPSSVKSIGDYAFYNCTSLTSVTIPSSVKSIGDSAFGDCTSLTSVTIPSSVKSIGDDAFSYCSNLSSITIPTSVTSIGKRAFEGCEKLISITIPNSVTSIGENAFEDCTSLTSVVIPSSVTSISSCAFYGCSNLTSVTIPSSVTSIGGYVLYGTKWLENRQAEDPIVVVNGILIDGKKCSGNVTIPSSVTSIGDCAFYGCSNLSSITIPTSVTSIGENAFEDCTSLTSINIPSSVTSISSCAFWGCTNLSSVTIPSSVTNIGERAFYKCTSLTRVTIPDGVISISDYAFLSCSNLTSVTIPDSVISIGDKAFSYYYNEDFYDYSYDDYPYERIDGFTIKGVKGSAAEKYATDNDFAFEALAELKITKQPTNATALKAGDKISFTVEATGTGLKYEWYIKDVGGDWKKTSAATSSYSCQLTTARNGRQVFCKVIDSSGKFVRSNIAVGNIAGTVIVVEQPKDVTVWNAGDTANFTVKGAGHGLKYEWYVKDPGGNWIKTGAVTNQYDIPITAARNGRQVFCKIIDFKGRSVRTNVVKANIAGTVVIMEQPKNVTVAKAGDTATFTIKSVGHGMKYEWYVKDPKGSWTKTGATSNKYSVSITKARNGRQVFCKVIDFKNRSVRSNIVTAKIK